MNFCILKLKQNVCNLFRYQQFRFELKLGMFGFFVNLSKIKIRSDVVIHVRVYAVLEYVVGELVYELVDEAVNVLEVVGDVVAVDDANFESDWLLDPQQRGRCCQSSQSEKSKSN